MLYPLILVAINLLPKLAYLFKKSFLIYIGFIFTDDLLSNMLPFLYSGKLKSRVTSFESEMLQFQKVSLHI